MSSIQIKEYLFGEDGVCMPNQTTKNKPTEGWLPVRDIVNGMVILDNNEKMTG